MYDIYRITKSGTIYWICDLHLTNLYTAKNDIERYIKAYVSMIDDEQFFAISRIPTETHEKPSLWQWRVSTKPQLISVTE